jgi:outer membrane receptor protein involved in Fe transport
VRTQAGFVQEELLMFDERLYRRGDSRRARQREWRHQESLLLPAALGSYRFIRPFSNIDEVKLRAAYGTSGNQARYGRFVNIANYGIIGGLQGYGQTSTIGNPNIEPETMNEGEYGFDAALLNNRLQAEYTYYDRRITNLLLNPSVAPSTGVTTVTTNGGEMQVQGHEAAITVAPIQRAGFDWTAR